MDTEQSQPGTRGDTYNDNIDSATSPTTSITNFKSAVDERVQKSAQVWREVEKDLAQTAAQQLKHRSQSPTKGPDGSNFGSGISIVGMGLNNGGNVMDSRSKITNIDSPVGSAQRSSMGSKVESRHSILDRINEKKHPLNNVHTSGLEEEDQDFELISKSEIVNSPGVSIDNIVENMLQTPVKPKSSSKSNEQPARPQTANAKSSDTGNLASFKYYSSTGNSKPRKQIITIDNVRMVVRLLFPEGKQHVDMEQVTVETDNTLQRMKQLQQKILDVNHEYEISVSKERESSMRHMNAYIAKEKEMFESKLRAEYDAKFAERLQPVAVLNSRIDKLREQVEQMQNENMKLLRTNEDAQKSYQTLLTKFSVRTGEYNEIVERLGKLKAKFRVLRAKLQQANDDTENGSVVMGDEENDDDWDTFAKEFEELARSKANSRPTSALSARSTSSRPPLPKSRNLSAVPEMHDVLESNHGKEHAACIENANRLREQLRKEQNARRQAAKECSQRTNAATVLSKFLKNILDELSENSGRGSDYTEEQSEDNGEVDGTKMPNLSQEQKLEVMQRILDHEDLYKHIIQTLDIAEHLRKHNKLLLDKEMKGVMAQQASATSGQHWKSSSTVRPITPAEVSSRPRLKKNAKIVQKNTAPDKSQTEGPTPAAILNKYGFTCSDPALPTDVVAKENPNDSNNGQEEESRGESRSKRPQTASGALITRHRRPAQQSGASNKLSIVDVFDDQFLKSSGLGEVMGSRLSLERPRGLVARQSSASQNALNKPTKSTATSRDSMTLNAEDNGGFGVQGGKVIIQVPTTRPMTAPPR